MCWCLLPHLANLTLAKQTLSSGHDVNSKWEFNSRNFRCCVSWWEDKLGVSQLCDSSETPLFEGYPLFDFASAWSWCSNIEWTLLSSVHSPRKALILDLIRMILVWLHIILFSYFLKGHSLTKWNCCDFGSVFKVKSEFKDC